MRWLQVTDNESLRARICDRDAAIGVIGLGYVGLPISLAFANAGFEVRGFDTDYHRVDNLRSGNSYVDDVTDEELQSALDTGFEPGNAPSAVSDCDVYLVAVPTGMDDNEPDMDAVKAAAETISQQAPPREALVVVSSTVYPGATRQVVEPAITINREAPIRFAMVPERLDPGSDYEFAEIPLVIGADDETARKAAVSLFETVVVETHPVDSTETAELTKTLENTYRMVNIALMNELITLAEGLNADVWDAIDAAATKPFGFEPFCPGPGVGGHCIPVDPQFLTWRARQLGTEVSFLDDAHRINEQMPSLVASRLEALLSARGVDIDEASIVALGAAYKPNVGDTRNSPAVRVIDRLSKSSDVAVVDPHTNPKAVTRELHKTTEDVSIEDADAVILLVDHAAFDLQDIGERAKFVFDTRNAMPGGVPATVVTLGETDGGQISSKKNSGTNKSEPLVEQTE